MGVVWKKIEGHFPLVFNGSECFNFESKECA